MTATIIILIVASLIGYMVFKFMKIKNMPLAADHEKIVTLTDQNFKHQVKSGIILVDFWAPWCGPCKMMAPILNDMAETEDVNIGKVNVDEHKQLAQKFSIRNIPTLIILKNGKEVKRLAGIKTKNVILKEMTNI